MYTKARCSYVTQLRNSFIQINDFAILISGIAKGRPGQAHAHNFEFPETYIATSRLDHHRAFVGLT